MDEVWKPIPSCPNYEASSLGRIRRAKAGFSNIHLIVKRQSWKHI